MAYAIPAGRHKWFIRHGLLRHHVRSTTVAEDGLSGNGAPTLNGMYYLAHQAVSDVAGGHASVRMMSNNLAISIANAPLASRYGCLTVVSFYENLYKCVQLNFFHDEVLQRIAAPMVSSLHLSAAEVKPLVQMPVTYNQQRAWRVTSYCVNFVHQGLQYIARHLSSVRAEL